MGLSTALLVVAALAAVAPVLATRLSPPRSIRDLEMSFVLGVGVVAVGTLVVHQVYGLTHFGIIHLAYLLLVVTVPVLLGSWYLLAFVRRRRTRLLRLGGLAAVVIALCGVWATHIEPNWLETDVVAVAAPVDEAIRIGVLADVQSPNVGRHEWNAVNTLIEAKPDIVLIPGDLYQGSPDVIAAAAPDFEALLRELVNNVEVVAVVSGDSDRPAVLEPITSSAGALLIDNQLLEVTVKGQRVRLAGVSVFAANGRLDTIAALSDEFAGTTVLLAHRPDVVFELPLGSHVDLIVSGHTHGGQVAFPFLGAPITLSNVPRSVAEGGVGIVDGYPVYVSTGVGLERKQAPQVRFGVRPSVGIIDVVPS